MHLRVTSARSTHVTVVTLAAYVFAVSFVVYALAYARLWYGIHENSDVRLYYEYASAMGRGLRPYLDFWLEYPPLAVPWFAWAGRTANFARYELAFSVEMVLACAATALFTALVAARAWPTGRRPYLTSIAFAMAVAANGAILFNRYDAVVALAMAAVLAALSMGMWTTAAMLTGFGFAVKVVPALLLPLVLVLAGRRDAVGRATLAFAASALAPFVPLLASGTGGLTYLLRYHADRPIQIESLLGTPLMLAHLAGWGDVYVTDGFGGQIISGTEGLARASGPLALVTVGAACAVLWSRRWTLRAVPELVPVAGATLVLAFLCAAKVLSPQYLVWLVPFAALVLPVRPVLGAAMLASMALTQIEFPSWYGDLVALRPGPVLLLAGRNAVVAVAYLLSLHTLWRAPRELARSSAAASADRGGGRARERGGHARSPLTALLTRGERVGMGQAQSQ